MKLHKNIFFNQLTALEKYYFSYIFHITSYLPMMLQILKIKQSTKENDKML